MYIIFLLFNLVIIVAVDVLVPGHVGHQQAQLLPTYVYLQNVLLIDDCKYRFAFMRNTRICDACIYHQWNESCILWCIYGTPDKDNFIDCLVAAIKVIDVHWVVEQQYLLTCRVNIKNIDFVVPSVTKVTAGVILTVDIPVDLFLKSHNVLEKWPTMHYFITEMCKHVHISVTKWCIVGLWDWYIFRIWWYHKKQMGIICF